MFESWGVRHPLAARLAESPPGVPLVGTLTALDLAAVDDAALLEVVAAWERAAAWAAAQQAAALAEMGRRVRSGRDADFLGDEVAVRLGTTRRAADMKVGLAVALDRAPAVHDALASGVIDVRKATVLTQEVAHLSPADAARIQEEVLPGASDRTAPQLRQAVRTLELAQDPSAAEERHRRARADRSVSMAPAACSMAWLTAYLPADDALCVMAAVDALAASCAPEDERGIDARRADALVDVMARVLDTGMGPYGEVPTRQHRRPHLQVTAPATSLLGLDDAPAVLEGYGPIPAPMARRIAARATWRPLLTDARTGELVARSSRTYRPSANLVGAVVDRDVTCTFPGCRVPAARCDIDHIEPFDARRPAEDQTTIDNLRALCRHHHRMKTLGGWRSTRDPVTGVTVWESPTGHVYTRDPIPADPAHHPVRPARHPRPTVGADSDLRSLHGVGCADASGTSDTSEDDDTSHETAGGGAGRDVADAARGGEGAGSVAAGETRDRDDTPDGTSGGAAAARDVVGEAGDGDAARDAGDGDAARDAVDEIPPF